MAYNLVKSKSRLNKNKSTIGSKNIAFIKTIVCLDICFLTFNLPRFILQLIKGTTNLYTLILQIATVFKYCYYALTVVLYLTTNSLFRDTLIEYFGVIFPCCNRKSRIQPTDQTNRVPKVTDLS